MINHLIHIYHSKLRFNTLNMTLKRKFQKQTNKNKQTNKQKQKGVSLYIL